MSDFFETPSVTELPPMSAFGISSAEGLNIRVGGRSYIFEKAPDTGEWLYVRNIPTVFPEEEAEDEPFDPSQYR